MFFIYKITNLVNNKIYLGQTNDPTQRWAQYKSATKLHPQLMVITRAMNKYGIDNFIFNIIATCKTREDINIVETELIKQYNSLNKNIGYNVDLGGGSQLRSPEVCASISIGLLKHYETNDNWNKGGTLPEEWKKAISEASIGKPGTNVGKTFDEEWKLNISKSQVGKENKKKRRFNDEQEAEICRLYIEEKMSTYALGKKFKATRSLIILILQRNNISMRKSAYTGHANGRNIFSLDTEKEICEIYAAGKITRAALAKQFNCGKTTIRDILLRNNVKL